MIIPLEQSYSVSACTECTVLSWYSRVWNGFEQRAPGEVAKIRKVHALHLPYLFQ